MAFKIIRYKDSEGQIYPQAHAYGVVLPNGEMLDTQLNQYSQDISTIQSTTTGLDTRVSNLETALNGVSAQLDELNGEEV